MSMLPHITVATIVERDGEFLMVKEKSNGSIVYNQPAGHLEENETLITAAERETLEETAWRVKVRALLGVYQYTSSHNGVYYVRHCFIADGIEAVDNRELDRDIVEAQWLSLDYLKTCTNQMRSPLVLKVIEDYLRGQQFPLSVISDPEF